MRNIMTTMKNNLTDYREHVQAIEAEYDEEGIFVYQAFKHSIADFAIEHQRFGGEDFNPNRMTWIKPSFAWVLYRSGYGHKHNQERILKIKLSHDAFGQILEQCACKYGGGGTLGRVQWDPARDLFTAEGGEPRKMLRKRAIQIGIKGRISQFYVNSVQCIEDVTALAHEVGAAHTEMKITRKKAKGKQAVPSQELLGHDRLPKEDFYVPMCSPEGLVRLGMLPGDTAAAVAKLGRGKV